MSINKDNGIGPVIASHSNNYIKNSDEIGSSELLESFIGVSGGFTCLTISRYRKHV